MPHARRRIKKARITHLSLCPRGKNRLPVLFKSDAESGNLDLQFQTLIKANDEEGTITAIVWPNEMPDSIGDVASADVVKEMSYGFMRELASGSGGLDLRHNLETIDPADAFIAESFIIQKGDPRFAGLLDSDGNSIEDPSGGWATVIKIDNDELRGAYRSGEWDGVSMYGQALVEPIAKSDFDLDMAASRIIDAMADRLATQVRTGEIEVDEKKLLDLLAERDSTLMETIKKEVTEIVKAGPSAPSPSTSPDPSASPPAPRILESTVELVAPVLKAEDIGNVEALAEYQDALHRHKLAQLVKWDDPASVAEYQEALVKLEDKKKKDKKGSGKNTKEEPVVKSAPAPSTQGVDDLDEETVALRKEQHDTASRLARAAGNVTGVGSFADKTD